MLKNTKNPRHCEWLPNCYYKQLKRKEQECEELKKSVRSNKDKRKKAIEKYLKLKEFTNKEFNKLKTENEKLKQYKASKQASYETMQIEWNEAKNEVKQLKARSEETIDGLLSVQYQLADNCRKYKQTLAEIKEIAESVTGCGSKCENCQTDGYCADCEDEILKQIIQKCEVIKYEH